MTIFVDAVDLSCARGSRRVLSGLSFALSAGEALILRGPNGAGKTTLLRTLAGLAPPAGGTLRLDPEQVAYAGHLDAVKSQLTVRENLAFWASVHGSDPRGALRQFRLEPLADRQAAQLSAGQKRRLGLARLALSARPVWLMDEPTSALDTEHAALIAETIAAHCAGGGAAVISTHLDLPLPGARVLEVARFAAPAGEGQEAEDPFLEGAF